ncbi:MAG TPA: hypothetical protein VN643_15580 [Pyrinomonadaceae bacterium]|nr:hypothetical protein [Pyrinomonadaceae bacterium]
MKRFHLIFGLLVLVIFALTGQYMHRYLNHLEGMADGLRMMYRTRHIFISSGWPGKFGFGGIRRAPPGALATSAAMDGLAFDRRGNLLVHSRIRLRLASDRSFSAA